MTDISEDLLAKLQNKFKNEVKQNQELIALVNKVKNGQATHHETNQFAIKIGEVLAQIFQDNLSADQLPNRRMYYNIASKVIDPLMINNYELVSNLGIEVQKTLNKKAKISIKPIKPPFNGERSQGIIQRVASTENFDDIKWLLNEPIVNFSQSVVDELIEANAEFQYESGLSPMIIRTASSGCCDWCSNLAGEYKYTATSKPPRDVFRRHNHCRCEVNYHEWDGLKQDVWSKKWNKVKDEEAVKQRVAKAVQDEEDNRQKKKIQRDLRILKAKNII